MSSSDRTARRNEQFSSRFNLIIESVVHRIEVDDHAIRIISDEATLEQGIVYENSPRCSQFCTEVARKNHLFAGSDGGGARWASACSLITTAKLNNVEPFAYLRDVLQRMSNGHPMSRLDDLLPWNWAVSDPTV